jgi:hypothetical protein
MNWINLLKIKRWTPLSNFPATTEATTIPKVRTVFENCYVHIQDHNQKLEKNDPNAPFVVKAYWAEDEAAIRRVATAAPILEVFEPTASPPAELLSGTNGTFGQIKARATMAAKATNNPIGEAFYARTGEFKYQVLTIDQFDYCFLSNEAKDDDKVFAIEVSLANS